MKFFKFFSFHKKKFFRHRRGFVLIFAILLITVVLTIGLAVLNISMREGILSSTARDSSLAFYTADTALECTLYQDLVKKNFTQGAVGAVVCDNQPVTASVSPTSDPLVWKYDLTMTFSGNTCAHVIVTKSWTAAGVESNTTIDSRGYNTSCPPGVAPRRLERGLQASY